MRARQTIGSAQLRRLFSSALTRYADRFAGVTPASLTHEDLHGGNLLFRHDRDGWRLAALLDFDKTWAGHAESDLARLELWRGMIGPGFWDAYGARCSIDAGYEARRPIYQLLWCLEYARDTPEHLVDTRRVCDELDVPAPANFDSIDSSTE